MQLWPLISMTGDLWTTVSRLVCLLKSRIHTHDVRTAVEGRSCRGQERCHSFKEDRCHERITVLVATADVSAGEDENRTGKRPRSVRTFSSAGAHALVLFKLTPCLRSLQA